MKKIINSILLAILIFGCSDPSIIYSETEPDVISVELNPRLDLDENGYYHLITDSTSWQTLHRISGIAYVNGEPLEALRVNWESSHYWYIGDTLGYIINMGLTDDLVYVSYDTSYITWFDGFEVPTINSVSYSNGEGELNTMFAPTRNMRSDSVRILMYYWDYDDKIVYDSFVIVLD